MGNHPWNTRVERIEPFIVSGTIYEHQHKFEGLKCVLLFKMCPIVCLLGLGFALLPNDRSNPWTTL